MLQNRTRYRCCAMSVLRSYVGPRRRLAFPLLINQPLAPSYLAPSFSTTSFREVEVGKETNLSSTLREKAIAGASPPNVDQKRSASCTLTHAAEETAPYVALVIVLVGIAAATGIAWATAHFERLRLRSYMDDRFPMPALLEKMDQKLEKMDQKLENMVDGARQLEIQSAVASALEAMANMQVDSQQSTTLPGPALDDLFADEQLASLLPKMENPTEESMGDLSNPMVMRTYYSRLLPWKPMFLWLNQSHVPTRQFTHREFAFTLQNEAYLRYQSFHSHEELRKEVLRLNPSRFEIGPMYSGRPKDRKALMKSAFRPLTRELVFDIDMTDYDSIRTCCKDKKMCKRCWKFITVAVKVLDDLLRTDFGFTHILWVYSGRRGIHAWISDSSAINLTDEQRSAIVRYIDAVKGYTNMEKRLVLSKPLHPSINRAFQESLKQAFASVVLQDQDCFRTDPQQWENVVKMLPDKENAGHLLKHFPPSSSPASSVERWTALAPIPSSSKEPKHKAEKYKEAVTEIIVQYTYPRIDTEVSRKLNHLLKAPFCIHPGTGKVCVPLLASQIDSFDPDTVPTVGRLLLELEDLARRGDSSADWGKTSLRPYVELFERHAEGVVRDRAREVKAEKAVSMEF
ncbi:DNA primase small subunit [Rhodotorula toruloides]|nr:DNA primase small subunit [Rhodotorula toruloides]